MIQLDSVYAQDLVSSIQKQPLLRMLRQWRNESQSRVESDLLNEVIAAILDGDFDG